MPANNHEYTNCHSQQQWKLTLKLKIVLSGGGRCVCGVFVLEFIVCSINIYCAFKITGSRTTQDKICRCIKSENMRNALLVWQREESEPRIKVTRLNNNNNNCVYAAKMLFYLEAKSWGEAKKIISIFARALHSIFRLPTPYFIVIVRGVAAKQTKRNETIRSVCLHT